ncbi:hypothetical protein SSPS47_10855 [Streptomyces sp. S4.7]|nr:hypothetical protein SSPS47_10855 [Streptomyces sp. S4.7]
MCFQSLIILPVLNQRVIKVDERCWTRHSMILVN